MTKGRLNKNFAHNQSTPPPAAAFYRLLADPQNDVSLKKMLKKYGAPEKQHTLLRVLQETQFAHQLNVNKARRTSLARSWFKKRDRWRNHAASVHAKLEALLREFEGSRLYPLLRSSSSLPNGYDQEIIKVFAAMEQLQVAIRESAILSGSFTTRGHQAEPYKQDAVKTLQSIGIARADIEELFISIGVKPDRSA